MTDKKAMNAFFARMQGRVQGVGFRYTCLIEAQQRGIHGWVQNTREGDVEVWAEGSPPQLEAFLAWLHHGPSRARVDALDCTPTSPTGVYSDFSVR